MSTEIEKGPAKQNPAKATARRYNSVEALMEGEAVSQPVRDKVGELKDDTRVVIQLAKLRQLAGITQQQMAEHLKVTQSAVSKLESGSDEDVTLKQIKEYARASGQRIAVMFGKPLTHVEAVKLHAGALKMRLESLANIANQHDEFQKEIKGFMGEAFFNLFNIIADCNDKLPPGDGDVDVEIEIKIIKTSHTTMPAITPMACGKGPLVA